jgi:hypothetical protein
VIHQLKKALAFSSRNKMESRLAVLTNYKKEKKRDRHELTWELLAKAMQPPSRNLLGEKKQPTCK